MREVHCEVLHPTQKSPCLGCSRELEDKNDCAADCGRLRLFRLAAGLDIEEDSMPKPAGKNTAPADSSRMPTPEESIVISEIRREISHGDSSRFDDFLRILLGELPPGQRFTLDDIAGETLGRLGRKVHRNTILASFRRLRDDGFRSVIDRGGPTNRRTVYEIANPLSEEEAPQASLAPKKTCRKCGERKDLDRFYRDRQTTDGLTGVCKTCWNERNKKRRRANSAPLKNLTAPGPAAEDWEEIFEIGPLAIIVDFEKYPDLLEKIRAGAEAEIRSIEQQTIYLIKRGLRAGK